MMPPGPQPPVSQPQFVHHQQQMAPPPHVVNEQKMKARRPTDKCLPDGIEDCTVDPEFVNKYNEARELERRLDATITRKRLDLAHSTNRHPKQHRTLRVWITNTVDDQPWQAGPLNPDSFDFSSGQEPSYRVKIEGRLLDDPSDDDDKDAQTTSPDAESSDATAQKAISAAPGKTRPRFSHFFKSLTVEFSDSQPRNGNIPQQPIEWRKPDKTQQPSANLPAVADFDELTFRRPGDDNVNIKVVLHRHENPERFKFSSELADVIDMKEGTREDAQYALWEYVRAFGLQDEEDKRNFRLDGPLKRLVAISHPGTESGHFPRMSEYIMRHLQPLDPVVLEYTVRVDDEFHKDPQPTVYDIDVTVDDPLRATLAQLFTGPHYGNMLKEVTALDDKLVKLVQATGVSKAKHAFLMALADDPTNFVRDWLSSQKRDLELIAGEATRADVEDMLGDEWRRGGRSSVWNTTNAKESINVLLSNPNGFARSRP
jgi:SWI/SNF-related matrix-associated actin-dependent regulator of chromatin subfamily D